MVLLLALHTCLELVKCFSILLTLGFVPDPGPVLFWDQWIDWLLKKEKEAAGGCSPGIVAQRKLPSGGWHTLRNIGVR